ncbi:poly(ADP-ribose) glycohydrolase-like isoform X2 [Varroa destructor]|uniref:poly(ADP-ribose) glycohydrolase n=1 Tax=Varroa destructor TaxID=109461 RepID=A0A7M7KW74_VARDE|nr:poly(ADP-ribose) glycohydrolase-like isoform X2 [Varroa destructor]
MSAPKTPPPKRLKVFVGDFLEKNSEVPSEASCNDAHISVPGNLKSMKELKLDDDNEQKSQSDTIIDIDDGSQETIGEELTVTSNDRKNMSGKRPNSPLDYDRHSAYASAASKSPKRFYSSGGRAVVKCTPFLSQIISRTIAGSDSEVTPTGGTCSTRLAENDSFNDSNNVHKVRTGKTPPSQRRIYRLPVNLNQTPGEIPSDMTRFPQDAVWRTGAMEDSPNHTILVKGPFDASGDTPCKAAPSILVDRWDNHHVKMPYSLFSKYTDSDGTVVPRWDIVQRALVETMHSFDDLREAILSYNGGYSWDLNELENVIEEMSSQERADFFNTILPGIVRLALNLPTICTRPPPLLAQGHTHSVTMSQQQAASLLANAFLCTFPRRNTSKPGSQYDTYPTINFHTLFNSCNKPGRQDCRKEKIKCLLNYFKRVTSEMPTGNLTFTRMRFRCRIGWADSTTKFKKAFVTSEGFIEDQGQGMLMVDFANRRVGGGVLCDGCVQEEILFVIYPELIISRLFVEALDDDEALLMTGPERFNEYTDYSDNFRWRGNVFDFRDRDHWGRKYTQLVAIDALKHQGRKQQHEQFKIEKIMRELVKSLCGFQTPGFPRSAVATGNWGCGAFGGDARLKFLVQWMAASRAGRPLVYFTFGDHELMCQLRSMQKLVTQQDITIGDMFLLLKRYDRLYVENKVTQYPSLYDFIHATFENESDSGE